MSIAACDRMAEAVPPSADADCETPLPMKRWLTPGRYPPPHGNRANVDGAGAGQADERIAVGRMSDLLDGVDNVGGRRRRVAQRPVAWATAVAPMSIVPLLTMMAVE